MQAAALASATDDAQQVTNVSDIIKEKHWNAFLTRAFGSGTSGNPAVGGNIVPGYPQNFHTNNRKEFMVALIANLLKFNNPHCSLVTGCPCTSCDQGSVERGNKLAQQVLKSIKSERINLDWKIIGHPSLDWLLHAANIAHPDCQALSHCTRQLLDRITLM